MKDRKEKIVTGRRCYKREEESEGAAGGSSACLPTLSTMNTRRSPDDFDAAVQLKEEEEVVAVN